jgi:hypothetical protein
MFPAGEDSNMKPKSEKAIQSVSSFPSSISRTDMNDVSVLIHPATEKTSSCSTLATIDEHDVSIVTIFDLQDEHGHGIGSHADDEVSPGLNARSLFHPRSQSEGYRLKCCRIGFAMLVSKVFEETHFGTSTDLVPGPRIRHAFDHTALQSTISFSTHVLCVTDSRTGGNHTVSVQIEVQTFLLEDVLE